MPKLDTMKARAASSGYRATLSCWCGAKTMCSYTSSLIKSALVGASSSARRCMSAGCQMVPLGLCGLLMMSARVLALMAAASWSKSGRKLPGVSGTRTTLAPVSSMLGT